MNSKQLSGPFCHAKTQQTEFVIEGISAGRLYGRLRVRDQSKPSVYVWEGSRLLGTAEIEQVRGDGTGRWNFSWVLSPKILNGAAHSLTVRSADTSVQFDVIGEPVAPPAKAADLQTQPKPAAESARAKAAALRKQAETLQNLLSGNAANRGGVARRPPIDLVQRYGDFFPDAVRKRPGGRDFIWLGVIRYEYRQQRPQHLITRLADQGHRLFYVAITFERADEEGLFKVISMPHEGVFILRLRLRGLPPKNIYQGFTEAQAADIRTALDEAILLLNITEPNVVVQYPSWLPIASAVPGATIVQDCLDYVGGFSNVPSHIVELEKEIIKTADVVVTSSTPLAEHVAPLRSSVMVRNAADVRFFAQAADYDRIRSARPVIGYFGAISDWYRVDWIERCAKARPDWDFRLIGEVRGADVSTLNPLQNVRLLGEQPYKTLPSHLAEFDVAIIPFVLNDLIRCTNPVKMYEYMAAGKPVVASAMPEVMSATPLIYIAQDAQDFEKQIERALQEDAPQLRRRRHEWASEHTWENRAGTFAAAIEAATPLVSIIILAYNNWSYTRACLHSVLTLSDYPKLEVLVVDNASEDETQEEMARIAAVDPRVKYVRNSRNLGFAAGNNVGLRAANGEYLVILNNDTYVTRGWVRDLIRPLMQSPKLGMAGPLTNNIGNEQKVRIAYENMQDMERESRRFTRAHLRERFETHNLAFFCVALRRDVLEKVGFLDEAYGLGFFEDDDYCRRAAAAGFNLVIVDDVFVHHRLSASFDALGQEQKKAQMQRNKAIYEERWGTWKPHKYRQAPGFG
jgi:GT2 family glycosyltransferase/glycosyltransferase involved in cell wall biosynthesis